MSRVKLTKLTIHRFANLKHVVLDLGVFTAISGKAKCAPALPTVANAIRFLCNCSELHESQLEFEGSRSNDPDDDDITYVEGQLIYPDGTEKSFRRSIALEQSFFFINRGSVLEAIYQRELLEIGIISLDSSTTFVLTNSNVNTVANFTDIRRSEFIDFVSGSEEIQRNYEALNKRIENFRVETDVARKKKTELTAQKKKLKGQIDAEKDRNQLVNELRNEERQLDLFTLFHNQELIDSIVEEIKNLKKESNEARKQILGNKGDKFSEHKKETLEAERAILCHAYNIDGGSLDFSQAGHYPLLTKELTRRDEEEEKRLMKRRHAKRARKLDEEIEKLENALATIDFREEHDQKLAELKKQFRKTHQPQVDEIQDLKKLLDVKFELKRTIAELSAEPEIDEDAEKRLKKWRETLEDNEAAIEAYEKKNDRYIDVVIERSKLLEKIEQCKEKREKHLASTEVYNQLREHFREKVVGRLSDLWNTKNPDDRPLLESRLREFKRSIVVDTKETAENCVQYLQIKQLSNIDEIFLPISEVASQKCTKDFLPRGHLPTGVVCAAIENLIDVESEDIAKLIVRFAKPSIVTNSSDDAEKLVKLTSTKKLNIIDTQQGTAFETRGTLSAGAEAVVDEWDDLEELYAKAHAFEQEEDRLRYEIRRDALMMKNLVLRNFELENFIQNATDDIPPAVDKKMKEDPDFIKYETRRKSLEKDVAAFFGSFLKEVGCKSVDEYDERAQLTPDEMRSEIELLKAQRDACRTASLVRSDSRPNPQFSLSEAAMKKAEEKLFKTFTKLQKVNDKIFEQDQQKRKHEEARAKLIEEYLKKNERIYDQLHKEQLALKDNYEILSKNFNECRLMDLADGSLEDFAVIPSDVTADYRVVQDQLNRVHVNFNKLKQSLKLEKEFAAKTRELRQRLEKIRLRIKGSKVKDRDDAKEQRLKSVNARLASVSKELSAKSAKLAEIAVEFNAIKESRRSCFMRGIKVINESLKQFCETAFANPDRPGDVRASYVRASLEVTDVDEPYLHDVIFYWRTDENADNRVNEINRDFTAALAFLLGVTKLKNQRFVILSNATQNVSFDLREYFSNHSTQQVVLLTSKMNDDHVNYLIRYVNSSFAFTRIAKE